MSITVNGSGEAWTKYSDTENKSTYARPTHTNKVPRLVIFSRKTPTKSGSDLGVASFDIKIVNGDEDADSVPRERNTLVDISVRDPQANASGVLDDAIDVLIALANDSTIIPNLQNGLIPQSETI
jgi:hypothetical protein